MTKKQVKNVEKKKTWRCKSGCKLTRKPCRHLEKLLQPADSEGPKFESVYKYAGSYVDRADHQEKTDPVEFKRKLEAVGLTPLEVGVFILRYVYDEPFGAISKELRINNPEVVVLIHNDAIKKLRKSNPAIVLELLSR